MTARGLSLGFAVLGSSLAWTAHLLLAWSISEFACLGGLAQDPVAGVPLLTWILLGVSLTLLGVSAASTLQAWRLRARLGAPAPGGADREAAPWLASLGLVLGVVLTTVIALQSLPLAWFLGGC